MQMKKFNIGYQCTTLQCERGLGSKIAMRWISSKDALTDYNFSDLDKLSNRFANILAQLQIRSGDAVFTFLPKCPEQFFSFLGALKHQCIIGTLFSNFGLEALRDRLTDANAALVVTTRAHFGKINPLISDLPELKYVILTDIDEHISDVILSYSKLSSEASDIYETPHTPSETPSVLHYTSGSTAKPKGVLHCHRSILHQSFTGERVFQFRPDDIFWCTADQGWVTGTSYGIIAPWSLGITQVHYGGGFDPETWMALLEREKITVWYTAPTALRMLSREADDLYLKRSLPDLRDIFSVGEPLNPEVIEWGRRVLQRNIHDTWWQTETGGIMVANHPGLDIRPGSMGKPLDGITIGIIKDGVEAAPGEHGSLCIKPGWHSMFSKYLNNPDAYEAKFKDGWYYTGDMAFRDAEGYIWFIGRDDDVINTSGHLISPFEIESCLLELSEIQESGVIAAPDPILHEKIVAYVHLRDGKPLDRSMEMKIKGHLARRLSSVAIPHELVQAPSIPKNKSGKIMRRYLKAQYLGNVDGDFSTMDSEP